MRNKLGVRFPVMVRSTADALGEINLRAELSAILWPEVRDACCSADFQSI